MNGMALQGTILIMPQNQLENYITLSPYHTTALAKLHDSQNINHSINMC